MKGEPINCPKCSYPTKETKDLSMSSEFFRVYYLCCNGNNIEHCTVRTKLLITETLSSLLPL